MGGGNPLKKAESSVKKFSSNPTRVALAAATLGGSELLRTTKNEVVGALTPDLPDIPNFNDIASPTNTPDPSAAADALANDAAMQAQLDESRKRGRASTILTGPQGLSGSTQYSARKTLLGV